MRTRVLERTQVLPGPPEDVFAFFADAHNLEAVTPPFLRFRVITPPPLEMQFGTLIQYRLRVHGLPISWLTSIQAWEPPHRFVDVQVRGPYALWHHSHLLEVHPEGTLMRDVVRYALPFGALGDLAHALVVRRDLQRIFDYRAAVSPSKMRVTPGRSPGESAR